MRVIRKEQIDNPFINTTGERIYEKIGSPEQLGNSKHHSFGHVVIPVGCSSKKHYHPIAEETYYILKGKAKILINDIEHILVPKDTLFIEPNETHQIFSVGEDDLEFLVICAPAWEPNNSVYLD